MLCRFLPASRLQPAVTDVKNASYVSGGTCGKLLRGTKVLTAASLHKVMDNTTWSHSQNFFFWN
jgi:hypothetical protein